MNFPRKRWVIGNFHRRSDLGRSIQGRLWAQIMLDSGNERLYVLKMNMDGIRGFIGGHGTPGERWGISKANSEYGERPYLGGRGVTLE
jgi:hypothetical protein